MDGYLRSNPSPPVALASQVQLDPARPTFVASQAPELGRGPDYVHPSEEVPKGMEPTANIVPVNTSSSGFTRRYTTA